MNTITDVTMTQSTDGIWDLSLDSNGDLAHGDSMDSSLLYAVYGEKRATPSEVPISEHRRGWIGNEGSDFENGSKLWLFEQERLTRSVLNDLQSTSLEAVNYLIVNSFLVEIEVNVFLEEGFVNIEFLLFHSSSQVDTRTFTLWQNTGNN